jgi:hypothetical protein
MGKIDAFSALVKRVPVEGTPYFLRVMAGKDWTAWQQYVQNRNEADEIRLLDNAQLLVRCLCDEDGVRLLEDGDAEQLVSQVDVRTLLQMFDAAIKLNTLSEVIEAEKKDYAPIQN